MLTVEQAILRLREDPKYNQLLLDSYLDGDLSAAATRFAESEEFKETNSILGDRLKNALILDIGAGTGIASLGFASCGASRVICLEPDPSNEVGFGAIRQLDRGSSVQSIMSVGEAIPLESDSVDVVYLRQTLHHAQDLFQLISECGRVLRPNGVFFACREHVIDNDRQLEEFLKRHPVHVLAGGENAYPLSQYQSAIADAGLSLKKLLGPFDTIINTFPFVRTRSELRNYPRALLQRRLGALGTLLLLLPGSSWLVSKLLGMRRAPGRLYSFLAVKECIGKS